MILFTCIHNNGGMKRIVEMLLARASEPHVACMIFGPTRPANLRPEDHWFEWRDYPTPLTPETIRFYKTKINDHFKKNVPPSVVIGDFHTLPYFEDTEAWKIADCHLLNRVLYQKLGDQRPHIELDQLCVDPIMLKINLSLHTFLKYETEVLLQADAFLSYSQNTTEHLQTSYRDVTRGKEIHRLQLAATTGTSRGPLTINKDLPFYCFSRWHPQKGFAFLFNENWQPQKLVVRGVQERLFTKAALATLNARGIELRGWTNDDHLLQQELETSSFAIFPSLYEPWGLALSEALALGKICVAHRNGGGHEEQIRHGINGFLIDVRPGSLMEDLQKIKEIDTIELTKIAEAARAEGQCRRQLSQESLTEFIDTLKGKVG